MESINSIKVFKISTFCNPNAANQLFCSDLFINTIPKMFYLLSICIDDSSTSKLIIIKGWNIKIQLKIIKYLNEKKQELLTFSYTKKSKQKSNEFTDIIMPQSNFNYLKKNFIQ
ncbi:unnamed protein product [Paramecium sonneborni]|uniref:Uncharacterized protein n=1 Tax=Paramecium sonneborni TaxID=65129 RepID=A0A8S1LNA6_9CILI|nr:unnamed protein product [Paramecium sonneborni]